MSTDPPDDIGPRPVEDAAAGGLPVDDPAVPSAAELDAVRAAMHAASAPPQEPPPGEIDIALTYAEPLGGGDPSDAVGASELLALATAIDARLPLRRDERTATELIARTPRLWLRPGLRLVTYVQQRGVGGRGRTFAVPVGTELPSVGALLGRHGVEHAPPGALDHPMEAVAGDGSPAAHVWASLLWRELDELGAFWHGLDWSTHRILGEPLGVKERDADGGSGGPLDPDDPTWTWEVDVPSTWEPQVAVAHDGSLAVTLHTFSGLDREALYVHTDVYRGDGTLVPVTTEREAIAHGASGYVF